MKKFTISSYCKINLSLRVIKKLNKKFHKIQSLITFANLFDKITVKEIKYKKDKIEFYGKFKKNINSKSNTITKTLSILRRNGYLINKKFHIKIKKNIPQGAGLGGGSINSATLINFLISKYKIKIGQKKILKLTRNIGSDVPLGIRIKNSLLLSGNDYLRRFSGKLNLVVVLVNPNIKCFSKKIYSINRHYSSSYPKKNFSSFRKLFNINNIKSDRNDLEKVVFKLYPKIETLNNFIKVQENCLFSRMTGSGSTCVGYFSKLKSAQKAKRNIRKFFSDYWCETAKTI